jgi:hypothetical protein
VLLARVVGGELDRRWQGLDVVDQREEVARCETRIDDASTTTLAAEPSLGIRVRRDRAEIRPTRS